MSTDRLSTHDIYFRLAVALHDLEGAEQDARDHDGSAEGALERAEVARQKILALDKLLSERLPGIHIPIKLWPVES